MADLARNVSLEDTNFSLENTKSLVKQVWILNQARPVNNTQVNTIGDYAANVPPIGTSMYLILFSLENWVDAVNNGLLPALATNLAAISELASENSIAMNDKLEYDNNQITYYASGSGSSNKNANNYVTQWQSQFNTDQTYYSVAQTNYQGVIQADSQALSQQGSAISNIISMMSQIQNSFVLVA